MEGTRDDPRLDLDQWLPWVAPLTFATVSLPLSNAEARLLAKAYETRRMGVNAEDDPDVGPGLAALAARLDGPVRSGGSGAFVRLSKRSGKDCANGDTRLPTTYLAERNAYCASEPGVSLAVADVIAVARALGTLLKVDSGVEAVRQLSSSQRLFTDITMAILQQADAFSTDIHIRSFAPVLPEMEFRAFVHAGRLTAITQYLSICFVPRIAREKDALVTAMQQFWATEVKPRVPINDYVVDFGFLRDGSLRVIELNPYSRATHAALFDWETDSAVLHGEKPLEARIVTAFDPTAALRLSKPILVALKMVRADVPQPPPPPPSSESEPAQEEQSSWGCTIS